MDTEKKLSIAREVTKLSNVAPGARGFGYSFPLPVPQAGEHFQGSQEFPACNVRNCAAFPEKIGVPIPEPSGNLKLYMPELDRWSNAEAPMDFRSGKERDE